MLEHEGTACKQNAFPLSTSEIWPTMRVEERDVKVVFLNIKSTHGRNRVLQLEDVSKLVQITR